MLLYMNCSRPCPCSLFLDDLFARLQQICAAIPSNHMRPSRFANITDSHFVNYLAPHVTFENRKFCLLSRRSAAKVRSALYLLSHFFKAVPTTTCEDRLSLFVNAPLNKSETNTQWTFQATSPLMRPPMQARLHVNGVWADSNISWSGTNFHSTAVDFSGNVPANAAADAIMFVC